MIGPIVIMAEFDVANRLLRAILNKDKPRSERNRVIRLAFGRGMSEVVAN